MFWEMRGQPRFLQIALSVRPKGQFLFKRFGNMSSDLENGKWANKAGKQAH
jgi:hypothetical protein